MTGQETWVAKYTEKWTFDLKRCVANPLTFDLYVEALSCWKQPTVLCNLAVFSKRTQLSSFIMVRDTHARTHTHTRARARARALWSCRHVLSSCQLTNPRLKLLRCCVS